MISLRILSFNGQETLQEIKEEIKQSKSESLSLVFPRKANIFTQKTDLQQLRNFCDTIQKEIIIITQNSKARKEIESIGIRTLPSLEHDRPFPIERHILNKKKPEINTIPDIQETEEVISDQEIVREKKASQILDVVENKHKYAPEDDVKKTLEKLNISYIPIDTKINNTNKNTPKIQHTILSKPALHSLFILSGIALLLFGFILNTLVPAANIIITPSKKEAEMSINANFLSNKTHTEPDLWKKHNGVFMTPLQTNFQFTDKFTHISKEFRGTNAKGEIKLINNTDEDITLRKTTKLTFSDGLIITLPEWEKIPKHGNTIIDITMPPKDVYGGIIGSRGNKKKGEHLTIPGLPKEMQKNVYAITNTPFTGGKSIWKYKIQKKDFEKAKKFFKKEAIEKAKEKANKLLTELNKKEKNASYRFLSSDYHTLKTEVLEYKFAENEEEFQKLISKEQGFIQAQIKVRITIYAYKVQDILNLIEQKYKNLAPDGMFLKSVNADLLISHIQRIQEDKDTIKVSFSTRGIYEYSLNTKSEAEQIFIMNIKKSILSVKKDIAKNSLINNFKEIANVEIHLFPFWSQSLPSLPEKIHITIHHD